MVLEVPEKGVVGKLGIPCCNQRIVTTLSGEIKKLLTFLTGQKEILSCDVNQSQELFHCSLFYFATVSRKLSCADLNSLGNIECRLAFMELTFPLLKRRLSPGYFVARAS